MQVVNSIRKYWHTSETNGTSRGKVLAHVRNSPYELVRLLDWFRLEVELRDEVIHAQGEQEAWGNRVGVWMARIEKRSNAGPEPRCAI